MVNDDLVLEFEWKFFLRCIDKVFIKKIKNDLFGSKFKM